MKTATAERLPDLVDPRHDLVKTDNTRPAFELVGTALCLRDGVSVTSGDEDAAVDRRVVKLPALVAGTDYVILLTDGGVIEASPATPDTLTLGEVLGGFHFAPGGNATARAGGDDVPAINACSIWDIGFRPACPDPRGMAYVDTAPKPFWCDIYLLGAEPFRDGSSKFGVTIADGASPPAKQKTGRFKKLDQPTAIEIYTALGKSLLSPEEFFAATLGVTEGTSAGDDPQTTGLDAPRTSRFGIMQATGNMSIWGTDGDPDGQRQAWRFGGRWAVGDWAGSRFAVVEGWPDISSGWFGARGRSDHLQLD